MSKKQKIINKSEMPRQIVMTFGKPQLIRASSTMRQVDTVNENKIRLHKQLPISYFLRKQAIIAKVVVNPRCFFFLYSRLSKCGISVIWFVYNLPWVLSGRQPRGQRWLLPTTRVGKLALNVLSEFLIGHWRLRVVITLYKLNKKIFCKNDKKCTIAPLPLTIVF